MKNRSVIVTLIVIGCCASWAFVAYLRQSAAPFPGWKQFGANDPDKGRVAIWLPNYYEGTEPDVLNFFLRNPDLILGEDTAVPSALGENIKIVLALRDTRTSDYWPTFVVSYVTDPSASTPLDLSHDELVNRFQAQQILPANLVEFKTFDQTGLRNARLIYELSLQGVVSRQIQYFVRGVDTDWSIIFIPNMDEYESELAMIENSMATFSLDE